MYSAPYVIGQDTYHHLIEIWNTCPHETSYTYNSKTVVLKWCFVIYFIFLLLFFCQKIKAKQYTTLSKNQSKTPHDQES
jgi:hypothetical protein